MQKSKSELIAQQVIGNIMTAPEIRESFIKNPDDLVKKVSKELFKKEPSKKVVDEVSEKVREFISPITGFQEADVKLLVSQITERVNQGFEQILWMSRVLFYLGVGIIAATFILDVYGVFTGKNISAVLGSTVVLGGIGILTIYQSTHKLMDRVKNSVGDLMQIKVAFFGFWDQLSVLMEHKSNKDVDSAIKISKAINKATENTMEIIQKYCETK